MNTDDNNVDDKSSESITTGEADTSKSVITAKKTVKKAKPLQKLTSTKAVGGVWVEEIPEELPSMPKSQNESLKLALIANPGKGALTDQRYTNRGNAEQAARAFKRSKPSLVSKEAKGGFGARVFQGEKGTFGIIVFYNEPENP